jgi:hypothetical protein
VPSNASSGAGMPEKVRVNPGLTGDRRGHTVAVAGPGAAEQRGRRPCFDNS